MNYCDEPIHQPFVSPHKTSLSRRLVVIFHQNRRSRQLKLDLARSEAFTPADFQTPMGKSAKRSASGNAPEQEDGAFSPGGNA
jgi:hypothetical protein